MSAPTILYTIENIFFILLGLEIMALNPVKNSLIIGIASGLVAVMIAPVLIPAFKRGSLPLAKGLIKGGLALFEKGREITAHAGEMIEDAMAEIQAEQAEKQSAGTAESELEEKEPSMQNSGNSQTEPILTEEGKNRTGQYRATSA